MNAHRPAYCVLLRRGVRLHLLATLDQHQAVDAVLRRQIRLAGLYLLALAVVGLVGTLYGVEPRPWAGPGGSAPPAYHNPWPTAP